MQLSKKTSGFAERAAQPGNCTHFAIHKRNARRENFSDFYYTEPCD